METMARGGSVAVNGGSRERLRVMDAMAKDMFDGGSGTGGRM